MDFFLKTLKKNFSLLFFFWHEIDVANDWDKDFFDTQREEIFPNPLIMTLPNRFTLKAKFNGYLLIDSLLTIISNI